MLYELLGFRDKEFPAGLGWHDRVMEGFPQASLWALARHLGVQAEDVATLVGFPVEQLDWRARGTLLTPDLSDTLLRIATAYHRLYALFKDAGLVSNWLRTARRETAQQIPVILLTTTPGAQVVYDAIDRIKPLKKVEMRAPEPEADEQAEEPAREDDTEPDSGED